MSAIWNKIWKFTARIRKTTKLDVYRVPNILGNLKNNLNPFIVYTIRILFLLSRNYPYIQ